MGKVTKLDLKHLGSTLGNREYVVEIAAKLNELIAAHNDHIQSCHFNHLPKSERQRIVNEEIKG